MVFTSRWLASGQRPVDDTGDRSGRRGGFLERLIAGGGGGPRDLEVR